MNKQLHENIKAIHNQCVRIGNADGWTNYVDGANIAALRKVAETMLDEGVI